MAMALLVVVGSIMVPVYDYFAQNNPYKSQQHLLDFFTNEKSMDTYMNTKGGTGIGSHKQASPWRCCTIPLQYLAKDPVKLAFGLGLGNASHSNLGEQFTGRYYDLFQSFAYISFSIFLLEIGVLGTVIVFTLYAMVFFDAIFVARRDTDKVTRAVRGRIYRGRGSHRGGHFLLGDPHVRHTVITCSGSAPGWWRRAACN